VGNYCTGTTGGPREFVRKIAGCPGRALIVCTRARSAMHLRGWVLLPDGEQGCDGRRVHVFRGQLLRRRRRHFGDWCYLHGGVCARVCVCVCVCVFVGVRLLHDTVDSPS
jgi:hypothetical protein